MPTLNPYLARLNACEAEDTPNLITSNDFKLSGLICFKIIMAKNIGKLKKNWPQRMLAGLLK